MGTWDRLLSAAKARGISIGRSEGINIGRSEGINIGRVEERKIIRERLIKAGINPLDADKYTELEKIGV